MGDTMRKLIMVVLALVVFAGAVSACGPTKYRGGDLRGGNDSID